MARAPKRPEPLDIEPPHGPVVHAKTVTGRGPTARQPHWYWRAVVYDGAKERTVWTGRGSREEVRAAVWQLIGRREHLGAEPAAAVDADQVIVTFETFSDLLRAWRVHLTTERTDLAPASVEAYVARANVLEEVLGSVRLDRLGRADLDRYRAIVSRPPGEGSRRRRARSSGTIQIDMTVAGMAWSWGSSIGVVDGSLDAPAILVKPTHDSYTPSIDEVATVVGMLRGWVADVVRLQWATGARLGELAALLVEDVDLERSVVWVGRHVRAAKTGARRVPIPADTLPMLRDMVAGRSGAVRLFPASFETVRRWPNDLIAEACAAAKIPTWTTHGLRRAFVIRGIRARIDVATLSTITGHSIQVMLRIYRQVLDEDIAAASALLPGSLPGGTVRAFRGR
jgi:integrase